MNEIDYFKKIILYSGDVTADIDNLYVKRIHLMHFSYIIIENRIQRHIKLYRFL
jgi:hypothetical protein